MDIADRKWENDERNSEDLQLGMEVERKDVQILQSLKYQEFETKNTKFIPE